MSNASNMSDYSDGSPSTYATSRQHESGPANLADASGYTSTTTRHFRYIIFGKEGYVSPNDRFEYTNLPKGENPTNKQRRGGGGAAGNP